MTNTPTVLSFGGGVNSTALLVGLLEREQPPDLVLFADTGGERDETYRFVDTMAGWMTGHGLTFHVVKNKTDLTLEGECIKNKTLPSLAFGFRGCSVKWKRQPMDRVIKKWKPAIEAWECGERVERLIGIDAGEAHRGQIPDDKRFTYRFPLIEWDWARDECVEAIQRAGLPVPIKSACWFCPAMRKVEVLALAKERPDLFDRAVEMEHNAKENLDTIKGLGRHWSWESLVATDEAQGRLWPETVEMACMCLDGEDA